MTTRELFEQWVARLNASPDLVRNAAGTIRFELGGEDGGTYVVRLQDGRVSLEEGGGEDADVTIAMQAPDFKAMARGELKPAAAFMSGKLRVRGDLGLAMQLGNLLR